MELECISGNKERDMKESGLVIKCMERELYYGQMVKSTLENLSRIEDKDMDNLFGEMGELIVACGEQVNNTGKDFTSHTMEE